MVTDENLVEMRCTLSSLAHVDRNRVIRIEVIGEKQVGMPGELLIDYVAVRVRRRITDA